jgi:hypothetical protein
VPQHAVHEPTHTFDASGRYVGGHGDTGSYDSLESSVPSTSAAAADVERTLQAGTANTFAGPDITANVSAEAATVSSEAPLGPTASGVNNVAVNEV